MKKSIIVLLIEIFLLFNLSLDIYFAYKYIEGIKLYNITLNWKARHYIIWITIYTIAALTIITSMVLVALLNLPAFQPLRDKLAARKQARNQAKAEKAEADKQARIEKLQNELEELKKD